MLQHVSCHQTHVSRSASFTCTLPYYGINQPTYHFHPVGMLLVWLLHHRVKLICTYRYLLSCSLLLNKPVQLPFQSFFAAGWLQLSHATSNWLRTALLRFIGFCGLLTGGRLRLSSRSHCFQCMWRLNAVASANDIWHLIEIIRTWHLPTTSLVGVVHKLFALQFHISPFLITLFACHCSDTAQQRRSRWQCSLWSYLSAGGNKAKLRAEDAALLLCSIFCLDPLFFPLVLTLLLQVHSISQHSVFNLGSANVRKSCKYTG